MKKGFTLAEVLITLAIIGVVAALTIPAVVKNYKEQEAVAKLKKAYSTLANTTNLIISQEGAVKGWATSTENIYELYKKNLKVSKDCGPNPGCMPQTPYKYLYNISSSGDWDNEKTRYKMVLADGSQFAMGRADLDPTCSKSQYGTQNFCLLIAYDINGTKPPNEVGRDLFMFALKEDGLKPAGCDVKECVRNNSGYACACEVIKTGKMNY